MAGKKTAKEIMDEWEASLRDNDISTAGAVADIGNGTFVGEGYEPKNAAMDAAIAQAKARKVAAAAPTMNALSNGLGNVVSGAQDIYNQAMTKAAPIVDQAAQIGQGAMGNAQQLGQDMMGGAKQLGQDAMQGAQGLLSKAPMSLSDAFQDLPPREGVGAPGPADAAIMQKLQALTPEQKAALLQQLGGQ